MSFTIDNLSKTFGKPGSEVHHRALSDFSLEIGEGEMVVLLGHSGCGKTTALRCLAGLETADEGTITLGDRVVFDAAAKVDVPPEKRNIGMVFQSYALWPHMTVRKNIAYPLKVRRMKEQLADGWVETAADLVDCGPLLDRIPAQLSGGQQQRVALARGIVARPGLVLMDEPLSNLDALLRGRVRNELHALHERLRYAGLYVTHDQTEALALGDRVAVMNDGRIEQIGTPSEVFEHPGTEHIATFVGMSNAVAIAPDGAVVAAEDAVAGGATLRFRPSEVRLSPGAPVESGDHHGFVGVVVDAVYTGLQTELSIDVGEHRIQAVDNGRGYADASIRGTTIGVSVLRSRCATFRGGVRAAERPEVVAAS